MCIHRPNFLDKVDHYKFCADLSQLVQLFSEDLENTNFFNYQQISCIVSTVTLSTSAILKLYICIDKLLVIIYKQDQKFKLTFGISSFYFGTKNRLNNVMTTIK
jgi:hypothetical protein